MKFDPSEFASKKQFGFNWFHIRPARSSDRDLVWQGYKEVPKDFFKYINHVSLADIERWYPQDKELDYRNSLPYNVMLLDDEQNEIEFAGNIALMYHMKGRYQHRAYMGLAVLPKFQKLGIGSYLTELSLVVAKAMPDIYRLELEVCVSNYARKIYPKFGYKEEAILEKVFLMDDGTLEDVIIMSVIFESKISKKQ